MTVNGSSLFPSEQLIAGISGPFSSRVRGDEFDLVFPTKDGSRILHSGSYTDASETSLRVMLSYLHTTGGGTLTKQ
jgi:hypothetical protein